MMRNFKKKLESSGNLKNSGKKNKNETSDEEEKREERDWEEEKRLRKKNIKIYLSFDYLFYLK